MTWQLACWITIATIAAVGAIILFSNRLMLGKWFLKPDADALIIDGKAQRQHAKHEGDTTVAKTGWRALKRDLERSERKGGK